MSVEEEEEKKQKKQRSRLSTSCSSEKMVTWFCLYGCWHGNASDPRLGVHGRQNHGEWRVESMGTHVFFVCFFWLGVGIPQSLQCFLREQRVGMDDGEGMENITE